MAVLLHDRPEAAGQKQREALRLPRTSAVVALFAFSSRMDRDSMRLFARTHGDEVRAAAIASTGQEVLELLHGGLRPQVLVLDALLTKPSVTQVLQEISTMQPDPEPAVLVLVPVPEETAARKALGLPLVAAYTSAMGWALTLGEGPGMSLQFTLPAAPPLDGMVLTSPTECLADRQNRRRLIRRELAVLVADTSMQ